MEFFYIGVNFGFNSSACLISSKKGIVAAISQERLNGEKNTKKLPIDAILQCCREANVDTVDKVVYSHYQSLTKSELFKYCDYSRIEKLVEINSEFANSKSAEDMFLELIRKEGIEVKENKMQRVEHHVAHAYSAFATYGKPDKYVAITSDGFGDGISGRIILNDGTFVKKMSEVGLRSSVALVYQFVTGALGYKMHQHEGKMTGLAAFGVPMYVDSFYDLFEKCDDFGNGLKLKNNKDILNDEDNKLIHENTQIEDFEGFQMLKKSVFNLVNDLRECSAKAEDIAASVQDFAERVTIEWMNKKLYNELLENNLLGKIPCYLAGGLFANVKLNQRVHESGLFSNVYVSPAMGDEGTCIGAATKAMWHDLLERHDDICDIVDDPTKNIFVGSDIFRNFDEIKKMLDSKSDECRYKIFEKSDDIVDEIAESLANKKIVCLCRDKMEFGPRALCHRSILYDCTDASVNDWLNKQLGRTEFMPFAPVTLEKHFDELFENTSGAVETSRFMTMTFDCKDEFVNKYPAACHIDETARPQIVNENTDEFMAKVLEKYEKKTGKKVLINTSFNLHNYPIIESPFVAIDSWLKSNTHVLVIGNCFIERK